MLSGSTCGDRRDTVRRVEDYKSQIQSSGSIFDSLSAATDAASSSRRVVLSVEGVQLESWGRLIAIYDIGTSTVFTVLYVSTSE